MAGKIPDELMKKKEWLDHIRDKYALPKPGGGALLHYTSLEVLFNILEKDSVWVSGTRFSNDSTEEALLKNIVFNDLGCPGDSFIICFSDKKDSLSQWRGYCYNGGVAIEFDIKRPQTYSILHSDYEISNKYEHVSNMPFPVLYVNKKDLKPTSTSLSRQLQDESVHGFYSPWKARDIIPYFKDNSFEEESEWRLMFGNHKGELSDCVRFRTMSDGSKVPYMIVKAGNVADDLSKCAIVIDDYSKEKLEEIHYSNNYIIRPY